MQKMVGLSQWLMHMMNFHDDEGYLLPRHPRPPAAVPPPQIHTKHPHSRHIRRLRPHPRHVHHSCRGVRSVPVATECFLRHRYMIFLPSFHDIFFGPCLTYIFIEIPLIPMGPGSSSWAASPVQQLVFEPPTSEDYNTGDTPPLEFQLDNLFRDTADEIGSTQPTIVLPVGTQPT
jgi:hypothetical protein